MPLPTEGNRSTASSGVTTRLRSQRRDGNAVHDDGEVPTAAYFVARAQVQAEHTGMGVREFLTGFARLRAGDVTATEAQKARATYRLGGIRSFAGLSGLIRTATGLRVHGLGIDALTGELAQVAELGAEELNSVAASLLPTQRALIVLVGDGAIVREQLEGLDLPPIEVVDPSGESQGNR